MSNRLIFAGNAGNSIQQSLILNDKSAVANTTLILKRFAVKSSQNTTGSLQVSHACVTASMLPGASNLGFSAPLSNQQVEALIQCLQVVADACYLNSIASAPAQFTIESQSAADIDIRTSVQKSEPHQNMASAANSGLVLLISGGVDSAVAAKRLLDAGERVIALHVAGVNPFAESELKAARFVAAALNIELVEAEVEWQGLSEWCAKWGGPKFNHFPRYNAVAFGRDLLLLTLGAELAQSVGASRVALAHEHEVWDRPPVSSPGRLAYRTELASRGGAQAVRAFLQAFYPGIDYCTPVADWTKYRIVKQAAELGGQFVSNLASCYWGKWCGRCPKCLTYGLLFHEHEALRAMRFEVQPLEEFVEQNAASMVQEFQSGGALLTPTSGRYARGLDVVKGTALGGLLRDPLGMSNLLVLSELSQTGRLPRGTAYEALREDVLPAFEPRRNKIRDFLLMPQNV